jgi:hypothetical protein
MLIFILQHWENSLREPQSSSEGSYRIVFELERLVFSPFDFASIFLFQEQGRETCIHPPPNMKDEVSVFLSPSDRATQLYSLTPSSLSSPSATSWATVEVS